MTSESSFPRRLTKIDDLTRPDHSYLTTEDECYFFGEYTARRGFAFSAANNLILNFKKGMDRRGRPEWPHKAKAIHAAAAAFRDALADQAREALTFVPMPPSKARDDPLYDDRVVRMLMSIWPGKQIDVRELLVQVASTGAVHDSETRPSPAQLRARYAIDEGLLQRPLAETIAVVDDVLTTGAHFRAAKSSLSEACPGVRLVGLFIARRVPDAADMEDFFDL
jgi:hypothetical protein